MIRIQSVTRTYGTRAHTVTALAEVTLSLEPGVWAVVGPNGAGKTTLLALILGFLRPSSGTIAVDGLAPRHYLRRHGAAYLPERFRLPPQWPVRGALRSLARLEGYSGPDADRRVEGVLDRLGLRDYAAREVGTLSRGLNQRLGLAQALLSDRDLVVLDEPTEGLDPLWRVRFREIVAELRGSGRMVLLASHELPEVERMADRVIILDGGVLAGIVHARQTAAGPLRYRIAARAPDGAIAAAFPDAERDAGVIMVTVADATELSHRLAALLESGGEIHEVTPVQDDLEARVRHRLEGS